MSKSPLIPIAICLTVTAFVSARPANAGQNTLEAGEDLPGGAATARASTNNRNAFSNASGNLSFSNEFDFKIGNAMFRKLWVSSPASTRSSESYPQMSVMRDFRRRFGFHL